MSSNLHPSLLLPYKQKIQRAAEKKEKLLTFLACGEIFTTTKMAAELLQLSEKTVLPMLKTMVDKNLLRVEEKAIPFSNLKLWGITAHGLALTKSADKRCSEFRTGRTSSNYLCHHFQAQYVHIHMLRRGWTNWIPDKILFQLPNSERLKKIPDALATLPNGSTVAIEVELNIKSVNRMAEMVAGHVSQIFQEHYDEVYYFTPHLAALTRVFERVDKIKIDGIRKKITDEYRDRFILHDIAHLDQRGSCVIYDSRL